MAKRKRKENQMAAQAEALARRQTQQQMELSARLKALEPYAVFNDMQASGNPITPDEIEELAHRRPSLWERFLAWARRREP